MSEVRWKSGEKVARELLAALVPIAPWYARNGLHKLLENVGPQGIEVSVKRAHRRHSDEQRGYYWMGVNLLAKHIGMSPDEMHEQVLIEWAGSDEKQVMGRTVLIPKARSSRLPVEAYSELIETLLRVAAWAGCVIPNPQEMAS